MNRQAFWRATARQNAWSWGGGWGESCEGTSSQECAPKTNQYLERFDADELRALRIIIEDIRQTKTWLDPRQVENEVIRRVSAWTGDDESDNEMLRDAVQICVPQMSATKRKARQEVDTKELVRTLRKRGLSQSMFDCS